MNCASSTSILYHCSASSDKEGPSNGKGYDDETFDWNVLHMVLQVSDDLGEGDDNLDELN